MIVLTGTIRIPADKLDQARALMKVLIEETRKEDGCLSYRFGVDVVDPGLIVIAEAWREANPGLEVSDRQLTVYEAVSSRPL